MRNLYGFNAEEIPLGDYDVWVKGGSITFLPADLPSGVSYQVNEGYVIPSLEPLPDMEDVEVYGMDFQKCSIYENLISADYESKRSPRV